MGETISSVFFFFFLTTVMTSHPCLRSVFNYSLLDQDKSWSYFRTSFIDLAPVFWLLKQKEMVLQISWSLAVSQD